MPTLPKLPILVSALLLWLGSLGCTPPDLHPVSVSGTTGILDGRPVQIFLGALEEPEGRRFRKELQHALTMVPGVVLHEPPWPLQQAPPPRSCLLTGSLRVDAQEELFTRGEGDEEKEFLATTVTSDFRFLVQDLATGLPIIEDELREEDREEVERPKAEPGKKLGTRMLEGALGFVMRTTLDILLDRKSVVEEQRAKILKRHRRELALRQEAWEFWLCSEEGLPGLQQGIDAARANDWQGAAAKFQQVAETQPHHSGAHKAYYDLGIACLALERFDQAKLHLLHAKTLLRARGHGLTLKEHSDYVERNETALEHCIRLDRMRRWRDGEPL